MGKRGKKTPSYTPAPAISPEVAPRVQAVLKVVTGQWTVTEAAAEVGMSRNRFQTLMHRSLEAMVAELEQKPAGRPARPERERELEEQAARLRRENERLQGRVGTIDRLLGVASDMLKGRIETSGRQRKKAKSSSTSGTSSTTAGGSNEPEDPDGGARRKLEDVAELRGFGLQPALAAAVVGVSASTVRRWEAARRSGQPLRRRGGPARAVPDPALVTKAVEIVRQMHGLVGADSLSHSSGLSRRQAAAIKQAEQTAMERERQAACARVVISTPGIVRGFDQMYVWTEDGWRYPLVSADGAVPYRTSILVAESYDENAVLAALEHDLEHNGAPLVWRRDRHSAHRTDQVARLLQEHGVLALQGPPHHPGFYGQLERQNRDHRAWLNGVGVTPAIALQPECDRMRTALNDRWRRRTLGWRTPAEAWASRPPITGELRDSFRQEVYARASRLEQHLDHDNDLAMRLAIEQALTQRGYLRLEKGVRC
jgi:DNA-binding transcriptional regulator YiaG